MDQSNVIAFPTQTEAVATAEPTPVADQTQRATKLFGAFEQMGSIKKIKEEIQQQKTEMVGEIDIADKLHSMVAALAPEEIAELNDEAVNEIYKLDGEQEAEFAIAIDNKERRQQFKRDFLVFLRESDIANVQIDEEMAKLEEELAADEAELKELISEFGDLSTFMRLKLQDEFDAAEGARKEKLTVIIDAYDDAYTLNRVYDHYAKFGVANTISDYYHRSEDVFARYSKIINKLNFRTDLTNFNQLEARLLQPEFNKFPNMFLFAIIKMYAYKKNAQPDNDGVFLSQLAVNLKSFYADSFASDEKKATFQQGIERVLGLFLQEPTESNEDTKEI